MKKSSASSYVLVLTTVAKQSDAKKMARTLVEEKWIACANILPIHSSIYRWKGKVQEDREFLLLMKTRKNLQEKLFSRLRQIHPYELPEILTLPIQKGLPAYLNWVDEMTQR